jgi:hypothetical protein
VVKAAARRRQPDPRSPLSLSSKLLDGKLGDGEAETRTAFGTRAGLVYAIEPLENPLLMLGRNPRAFVCNLDDCLGIAAETPHRHH